MKFGDWIDVFTFQKEINFNSKFNGIENILKSLCENERDDYFSNYFSRFIFCSIIKIGSKIKKEGSQKNLVKQIVKFYKIKINKYIYQ